MESALLPLSAEFTVPAVGKFSYTCKKKREEKGSVQAWVHRFTEIGQNFHNEKKWIDIYIFLIKVKLILENSFDIYFLFILFRQLPEIDKGHRDVLAKFYSREITSLPTAVTPSHHRRERLDQN